MFLSAIEAWSASGAIYLSLALSAPPSLYQLMDLLQVVPAEDYEKCIDQLFREAAQQYPECIALAGARYQLTYAQLNSATDNLAAFLRVQ